LDFDKLFGKLLLHKFFGDFLHTNFGVNPSSLGFVPQPNLQRNGEGIG